MPRSRRASHRSRELLLAVPEGHADELRPLMDAWRRGGVRVEIRSYAGAIPDAAELAGARPRLDALVLAGPVRHAPRTALPGPFLTNGAGRTIPAAWLPVRGAASCRRFAIAAAHVHARPRQRRTLALLGQWHPRYLRLADRIERLLPRRVAAFRWTAEAIVREDLVQALGAGLGLGLYVGHGRPVGWAGYHGVRARHFDGWRGEPVGGLVSLCCRTASRRRTGLSWAEALPLLGVAAASFGAVEETRHTDNARWAVGLCAALRSGASTVGDLLVRAAPPQASARAPYRLVGDPLTPILAAHDGVRRASAVATHA